MDFGTEEKKCLKCQTIYSINPKLSKASNNFYWHQYQYKSKWNLDSTSYFILYMQSDFI